LFICLNLKSAQISKHVIACFIVEGSGTVHGAVGSAD